MNILFSIAMWLAFGPVAINCSNCTIIRKKKYEKEVLTSKFHAPFQLTIVHATDTLLFSYTVNEPKSANSPFALAVLNLINKQTGNITAVQEGFATAVDDIHNNIYAGGSDGIYNVDIFTCQAKNLYVIDANIWQMFYKDALYFTTFPDKAAFVYKDSTVSLVEYINNGNVKMIAIEKFGNTVFYNNTGLFVFCKTEKSIRKLGSLVLNGFTSDVQKNLYFSTTNMIYQFRGNICRKGGKVEKLVNLEDVYGLAIESNGNFIYATNTSIIRLKPTKKICDNELNQTSTTTQRKPSTINLDLIQH